MAKSDEIFISNAIERAVRDRIDEIIADEVEKALKVSADEIKRRIYASVDNLALNILSEYDVQQRGDHVIITVKKGDVPR